MIIPKHPFGRGFNPLSNPKHKTCWLRRANNKRNKRRYIICTRVNRDLLTSVLTSTALYTGVILWSKLFKIQLVNLCTGGYDKESIFVLYLSVLILLYIACPADVLFGTASFPKRCRTYSVPRLSHTDAECLLYSR